MRTEDPLDYPTPDPERNIVEPICDQVHPIIESWLQNTTSTTLPGFSHGKDDKKLIDKAVLFAVTELQGDTITRLPTSLDEWLCGQRMNLNEEGLDWVTTILAYGYLFGKTAHHEKLSYIPTEDPFEDESNLERAIHAWVRENPVITPNGFLPEGLLRLIEWQALYCLTTEISLHLNPNVNPNYPWYRNPVREAGGDWSIFTENVFVLGTTIYTDAHLGYIPGLRFDLLEES